MPVRRPAASLFRNLRHRPSPRGRRPCVTVTFDDGPAKVDLREYAIAMQVAAGAFDRCLSLHHRGVPPVDWTCDVEELVRGALMGEDT